MDHHVNPSTDAVLKRTTIFSGWMSLVLLEMRLGGTIVDRPVLEHPCGSAVLAYDPVRRLAIVTLQTRQAVLHLDQAPLLEAVGGVRDEGERPSETARREMLEETGIAIHDVEFVANVWMTPSSTTERISLFLGQYLGDGKVAARGGLLHEQEDITVLEISLETLWSYIESGIMMDGKLLMMLQALRIRQPVLFS